MSADVELGIGNNTCYIGRRSYAGHAFDDFVLAFFSRISLLNKELHNRGHWLVS